MSVEPLDLLPISDELPEQAPTTITKSAINSDVNFITIFYRWQPMGYRVVINLPYVSDDQTPLFAIKNGPYIPPVVQATIVSALINTDATQVFSPVFPLPGYNSSGTAVTATRYDAPPPLAIASWAYRFWRGSMKYRFRCVSNFTAQGYVIVSAIKGVTAIELFQNTSSRTTLATGINRHIPGASIGYRAAMQNAYVMSDVSMFRHNEIELPFEYPVSFYDQYKAVEETIYASANVNFEVNCPDNFVVVFNRGAIVSPQDGAQVVYELEYAPGPDFEFSSEFLFSRAALELGNNNVSLNFTDSVPTDPSQGLPFTYPVLV